MTVAEAAARLALSTDAVRSRLNRGTLEGRKEPDGWVVYLPLAGPTVAQPSPTVDRPSDDRAPTVAALEAMIAGQREEIAFLRDQLDQRSRELAAERERSDVLMREALARIPALAAGEAPSAPPGPPQHAEPSEPAEDAPSAWRRFLRLLGGR